MDAKTLKVRLDEVPAEGQVWRLSRESGELDKTLQDLVGTRDYIVELSINPVGGAYELRGYFRVNMGLVCSRCAWEFESEINEKFHEILVVQSELPRNGHMAKANHSSEMNTEGPFYNELRSNLFDLGEYIHEIVALSEPTRPLGTQNCDDQCPNLKEAIEKGWVQSEEPGSNSPFSVLAQMKQ